MAHAVTQAQRWFSGIAMDLTTGFFTTNMNAMPVTPVRNSPAVF
jgi:hypothetical protein